MGRFLGHVIVSPTQAEGDAMYPEAFERLLELATAEGIEREWVECSCVGAVAQEAVDAASREKFGTGPRSRWASFVAAYPAHATVPYTDAWLNARDVSYAADRAKFLDAIHAFKAQALAAHPDRTRADPTHEKCGGTGRYFEEGQEERRGLFISASPEIRGRGRVVDLLRDLPFAVFLPDGTAGISDRPETWEPFGASWPAAVRVLLAPHRGLAFVEIEFMV